MSEEVTEELTEQEQRLKSDAATLAHIHRVQALLNQVVANLMERARLHDQSKLCEPEASTFAIYTHKLATCTYGSDEYKQLLAEMKPALDHHYSFNTHHPEHWSGGIKDMTLLDLIEMIVDWKAATERHNDGDLKRSIEINQQRFGYSDELKAIFLRTAGELFPEWLKPWGCTGCGAGGVQGNFCYACGGDREHYGV